MNAPPQRPPQFQHLPHRTLTGIVLLALVVSGSILLWLYIVYFRSAQPTPVYARIGKPIPVSVYRKGHNAYLTLQTVGDFGHQPHADWVSYLARTPHGTWVHSTVFRVPSYSLVHVTVYQYDSATGLRNPFFARARGIVGRMTVNGKPVPGIAAGLTSHTFVIPELGIGIPLEGVPDNAKNTCDSAPCPLGKAHMTMTFTIRTAGPGTYRWQCFVPCAAGFIYGNGGPMQTLGWMDGYLVVM